ncbi:MAG: hypothetical protein R2751_16970 [Bacteroidales bacterium]
MSGEQADIVAGIRNKIQMAREKILKQEEENRRLEKDNADLKRLLDQKQSMIEELEQKNRQMLLVKGVLAEGQDAQDARLHINRIVREIDKCIALLNR